MLKRLRTNKIGRNKRAIKELEMDFEGDLFFDDLSKIIYATDASAYREIPFGVSNPKTKDDLKLLIDFANKNSISLIPRGAGTSLAGQVVGDGLVIDFSRYFDNVLERFSGKMYQKKGK